MTQRSGATGLSTDCQRGSPKGDVYSFAIILHEIIYRAGLFRCFEQDELTPAKSESTITTKTNFAMLTSFVALV